MIISLISIGWCIVAQLEAKDENGLNRKYAEMWGPNWKISKKVGKLIYSLFPPKYIFKNIFVCCVWMYAYVLLSNGMFMVNVVPWYEIRW